MSANTKTCTGPCGATLPLEAFHRNGPRRRHSVCRDCRRRGRVLTQLLTLPISLLERF